MYINPTSEAISALGFNPLETTLVADHCYEELRHVVDDNDGLEIGIWDTDFNEWVELYV